jgi:hypothetical protein
VKGRARRPHTSVVTKLRRPMQCCGGLNAPDWAPICLLDLDLDFDLDLALPVLRPQVAGSNETRRLSNEHRSIRSLFLMRSGANGHHQLEPPYPMRLLHCGAAPCMRPWPATRKQPVPQLCPVKISRPRSLCSLAGLPTASVTAEG